MIKHIQKRSLETLIFSLLLLSSLSCTGKPTEMDVKMQNPEISLWQCVEALIKSIPFAQKKVEAVVSVPLKEVSRDEYTIFLEGYNALLTHGQKISKVDLRLANTLGSGPGFLVFDISGPCISLDEVKLHYPKLMVIDRPHGHSLNEATVYTSEQSWGNISFGFTERNPDCLAGISFKPKKHP